MALAAVVAGVVGVGGSAHAGSFQTIYSFKGAPDGYRPNTLVAFGGKLYGVTEGGGYGTVFSVTPTGTETILHNFAGPPDGFAPGSLIAFDRALFGTTSYGGSGPCGRQSYGCGAVFGVAPRTGKERIVTSFEIVGAGTKPYGAYPQEIVDLGGALYGIASGGPNNSGVVFKIQNGVESVIYSFAGGSDGAIPMALIRIGDTLYGTTANGGAACASDPDSGCGTIFKLTPDGTETVLYAFTGGADGASPYCLVNGGGALFACVGGSTNGSIAELRGGKLRTVYTFKGGSDGSYPNSLVHTSDMLYGTTGGGTSSDGTLFSLTKDGQETVLHAFADADYYGPMSLIESGGTLYGVTFTGGSSNNGTVFSYTP